LPSDAHLMCWNNTYSQHRGCPSDNFWSVRHLVSLSTVTTVPLISSENARKRLLFFHV
jgi:hypothetical protein